MSVISVRDPYFRLALLKGCDSRCVWCTAPLGYAQLEIEHLLYKNASPTELSQVVRLHALPTPYNVHETYNLAASCRTCNGRKGTRLPPKAPIVSQIFEDARHRAPEIEVHAATLRKHQDIAPILAFVDANRDDPNFIEVLTEHLRKTSIVASAGLDEAVFLTADTQMTFKAGQEVRVVKLNSLLITSFAIAEAELHLRYGDRKRTDLFHPGDNFGKISYWLWCTDKNALWRMMADYMSEIRQHNPHAPDPRLAFSDLLVGLAFALPSYVTPEESKRLIAEASVQVPVFYGADMDAE